MRNQLTTILLALMMGLGAVSLTACSDDGSAENAGEQVDEAIDEAGDAVEDAAE